MSAARIGAELDVEAHAPAAHRRAADPGPGVRDAEIRVCVAAMERETWLLPTHEHQLARAHGAPDELRERLQRKRHAGQARTPRVAIGSRGKASRIRQPCSETTGCRFRPLTAQVGVI